VVQHYGDTDTVTTKATTTSASQRYEEARAAARQAMTRATADTRPEFFKDSAVPDDPAYRGFKFGAAFFGWLVAISMTVLLAGVVGAIAVGVESVVHFTRGEAEQRAGTLGIAAAVILILAVSLAFYTGGYVAGRLARFDGGRQGFGVWIFALFITIVAAGVVALANTQNNVIDRINLPNVPLSDSTVTTGAISTAAALVLLTLLAALLGGNTGRRYHDKIDNWIS
jgi:hypothetical protein